MVDYVIFVWPNQINYYILFRSGAEEDDALDDQDSSQEDHSEEMNANDLFESVMSNKMVNDYEYDRVNYLWCKITFNVSVLWHLQYCWTFR